MKLQVVWYLSILGIFNCFQRISGNADAFPRRDKVPVVAYNQVNRLATPLSIGQCIRTRDKNGNTGNCNGAGRATGNLVFRASSLHSGKLNRVEKTTEYESVTEGGVGVGISLCGLFSASISGRVRRELKTKSRSITMMAILNTNYGHDSLTNMKYNNGQGVPHNLRTKYFVSDIEYGSRSVLKATMNFRSRQTKTLIEVTIKVKILFLSFSKTIRHVKETSSADFYLEISHVNNHGLGEFRTKKYGKGTGSDGTLDQGIRELEKLEKTFESLPDEMKKLYDNQATRSKLAMNYYVLPYSVLQVTSPPDGVVVLKNAVSFYLQKRLLRIYEEMIDIDESLNLMDRIRRNLDPDLLPLPKCVNDKRRELDNIKGTVRRLVDKRKLELENVLDKFYRLENAFVKNSAMTMIESFGRRETARSYRGALARHCPDLLDLLDY